MHTVPDAQGPIALVLASNVNLWYIKNDNIKIYKCFTKTCLIMITIGVSDVTDLLRGHLQPHS